MQNTKQCCAAIPSTVTTIRPMSLPVVGSGSKMRLSGRAYRSGGARRESSGRGGRGDHNQLVALTGGTASRWRTLRTDDLGFVRDDALAVALLEMVAAGVESGARVPLPLLTPEQARADSDASSLILDVAVAPLPHEEALRLPVHDGERIAARLYAPRRRHARGAPGLPRPLLPVLAYPGPAARPDSDSYRCFGRGDQPDAADA